MSFDISLSKSGTSYVVTIPSPVVKSLNLKRGQKLELVITNECLIIPFGWYKFILRWEKLLEGRFYANAGHLLNPSLLHPIYRVIMQCFFSLGIHMYSKVYGPDHIKTQLYKKILNEYYIDHELELIEFEKIKDEIPKIFDQWWSIGDIMHYGQKPIGMKRASDLIEYFESDDFYEFFSNEVVEKQFQYELNSLKKNK